MEALKGKRRSNLRSFVLVFQRSGEEVLPNCALPGNIRRNLNSDIPLVEELTNQGWLEMAI